MDYLRIQLKKNSPTFPKLTKAINNAIEFERMRIYLRSDVFTALVVVIA